MSGYLTTNENGEFTGTVIGLTTGQKVITATFEGDDEYNRSTINKHITILDPTIELSLTSPTPIIETGGTSVITATLTRNGLPFVNQEISYEIKHGSTVIDADSDFTNNSGQITISYTGTGAGDINIIASFGSYAQKTLAVQDCIFYDDMSTNKLSQYTTKIGSLTSTYNNGYIEITSSNNNWNGLSPISINSANDWSMECEIESNSSLLNGVLLLIDSTNFISDTVYTNSYGYGSYDYPYSSSKPFLFTDSSVIYTAGDWYKFKLELKSNTLYYYLYDSNGVLLLSKTVTLPSRYQNNNLYFCPLVYGGTAQFKNVKIKAL